MSVLDEEQEPPPDTASGITGEPEPMSEKDLREASTAIDVFGYPLVSDNTVQINFHAVDVNKYRYI